MTGAGSAKTPSGAASLAERGTQASHDVARVVSVPPDRALANTYRYAEAALERIEALHAPADPPSFHLWYAYATKMFPALNQAIDDLRTRELNIPVDELDRIYDHHLAKSAIAHQVSKAGMNLQDEIAEVLSGLDGAAGGAAAYSEELAQACNLIDLATAPRLLRKVLDQLRRSTVTVIGQNRALQSALHSSKQEISRLQSKLELICQEGLTDPLTSLANRRQFDLDLHRATRQAAEAGQPLSLLMCDVDHFKAFNDKHGHTLGDQVLRLIARAMKLSVRGQDTTARYGGEEFAIILPNTTLDQAAAVAENVRRSIIDKKVIKRSTGEVIGQITLSIGAAQFEPGESAQSFIERADARLYAAKRAGRNRVAIELQGPRPV